MHGQQQACDASILVASCKDPMDGPTCVCYSPEESLLCSQDLHCACWVLGQVGEAACVADQARTNHLTNQGRQVGGNWRGKGNKQQGSNGKQSGQHCTHLHADCNPNDGSSLSAVDMQCIQPMYADGRTHPKGCLTTRQAAGC